MRSVCIDQVCRHNGSMLARLFKPNQRVAPALAIASCLAILAACAKKNPDPSADFAMICAQAKSATGASSADRTTFSSAVEAKLKTNGARKTFGAAASVPDAAKLFILKAGAKELGVATWDCPEISKVVGTQYDSFEPPGSTVSRHHRSQPSAAKPGVTAMESSATPMIV